MSFGGAGTLPADDLPGSGDVLSVRNGEEIGSGNRKGRLLLGESMPPPECHGMGADSVALSGIVGIESLQGRHGRKRRVGIGLIRGWFFGRSQRRLGLSEEVFGKIFLHLPQALAAVFDFGKTIEGARSCEEATFFLIGTGPTEKIGKVGELSVGASFDNAIGGGAGEPFEAM